LKLARLMCISKNYIMCDNVYSLVIVDHIVVISAVIKDRCITPLDSISWGMLAVVTNLVQPAIWRTTGTMLPRSVWRSAMRPVDWAVQAAEFDGQDSMRHLGDVTQWTLFFLALSYFCF